MVVGLLFQLPGPAWEEDGDSQDLAKGLIR